MEGFYESFTGILQEFTGLFQEANRNFTILKHLCGHVTRRVGGGVRAAAVAAAHAHRVLPYFPLKSTI